MPRVPKYIQKILDQHPIDKDWEAGDRGWSIYRYSAATCTVVPVVVTRKMDDRGMMQILLPGLWGSQGFQSLCWPFQVYATQERAEAVMKEEGLDQPLPDDVEF